MWFIALVLLSNVLFINALPTHFDYRQKWKECSAPVVNQKECGACWAIAVASSYTARACMFGNAQERSRFVRWTGTQITPQNMISCAIGKGCIGGWPQMAWQYMKQSGSTTCGQLCQKGCQPFRSVQCSETGDPGQNGCIACQTTNNCMNGGVYERFHTHTAFQIPATAGSFENNIMQEVYAHGPVVATYMVYENFYEFFKKDPHGIYTQIGGKATGGHAVIIVGWGEENGVKYWIVQNSWGSNWGSQGFFKIIRGVNIAGLEENVTMGCPNNAACFPSHPSITRKRSLEEELPENHPMPGAWSEAQDLPEEFVGYMPDVMSAVSQKRGFDLASFVSIEQVRIQPVAGINIEIQFKVNLSEEPKLLRAVIHKSLEDEVKILRIEEVN